MRQLAFAFFVLILLLGAAPAHARADAARELLPTPPALPSADREGRVAHDGAQIWFAGFGGPASHDRPPVILLHGGDASSDIWGFQVAALRADHRRVIVIDSRGHGRSSWDGRLGYELMASDVIAVMDAAHIDTADVVGWSDGAIVSLIMAMNHPQRVRRIFAFGANTDVVGGLNPLGIFAPASRSAVRLLRGEYARDTGSTAGFKALMRAVMRMQLAEPNYLADKLAAIHGPAIAIADGDHDEIIRHRHTEYLARTIPGAELIWLPDAGHFAPLQAPDAFNAAMLSFIDR
ncbi:MAG TPA: alpha/beta hydrolase [Caulobacteraceae bacterium]|nr:alpha/beta hydrolase [Caulobacteraceae bacterium]